MYIGTRTRTANRKMRNRFCLLMIVRDEETIIERCLDSVKNIFDTYIICDTGSVDGTVEKIKMFMEKHNKTGEVTHRAWKNFGENKSYVLKYFRHESKVSDAKYIMWLDADEVFIRNRNDTFSYLTQKDADDLYTKLESAKENVYMFPTLYCGLQYDRWQIARNNQDYRWDYPVHELFVGAVDNSMLFTNFLYNFSRKEGNSSKSTSTRRDAQMLEDYLKENPNEPRCTFYLAQVTSDIDQSIENYKKRLELGGYNEEKYMACLRLGRLLKNEDEKISYWLRAIDIVPERLESIYELMMLYHNKNNFKRACTYGRLASDNRTNMKFLFQEHAIYEYKFDYYFALCLYYNNEYDKAYIVGRKTMDMIHLCPPDVEKQARANMIFYEKKRNDMLPILQQLIPLMNPQETQMKSQEKQLSTLSLPTSSTRNKHPPTIVIIDDYYEDPDSVRKFALAQVFNVKGNYPGGRTKSFATEQDKLKFESILGQKIIYFPTDYNGSYQLVTGTNTSWIHRDETDYSVVVFLTPNPPPHGGTILYQHIKSGIEKTTCKEEEDTLNNDSYNESNWHQMDRIGNKYNRAIIFQGKRSHKSDEYFGHDMESGRLFQTFFFNVEK